MRCSFYKSAIDDGSTIYVEVLDILDGIKNGKYKDRILAIRSSEKREADILKKGLPAAVFAGTFKRTKEYDPKWNKYKDKSRLDKNLVDYTQLVVLDIDLKNEKKLERVRSMMREDPWIFAYFYSPSKGLKVLIMCDVSAEYHRDYSWAQISDYVDSTYDIPVDSTGKNISRLCFVSYDPELYYNPSYEVFKIDTTPKVEDNFVAVKTANMSTEESTSLEEIFSVAKGWLTSKGKHYRVGNRNQYLHDMACILNRAGLSDYQIEQCLLSNHAISQDMYTELQTTIKGVVTRHRGEFGSYPIHSKSRNNRNGLFD